MMLRPACPTRRGLKSTSGSSGIVDAVNDRTFKLWNGLKVLNRWRSMHFGSKSYAIIITGQDDLDVYLHENSTWPTGMVEHAHKGNNNNCILCGTKESLTP